VTVLAAVTVATTLAACGSSGGSSSSGSGSASNEASDTGITADSIKIGATYPLTGVAAPGYSDIPTGVKAYFDYVNSQGGVNGRKIDYVYKDDGYNPTNTSSVTNDLVLNQKVFATMGSLGTAPHNAVLDFLNSEGVPDLFVASGSSLWDNPKNNPETFGWQTDYESEGKIIGQYIKQNFPNAKVGLFLQDDDFGVDGERGIRKYLSDSQIVAVQRYTSGNTDVGPQIAGLQSAGADLVVGFNTPAYTALTQLVSLQLGFKPQWFYSNVGSDPSLVGALLNNFSKGKVTGAGLLDKAITTQYLPGIDSPNDPWVQLFQKVWDASGQQGQLTNFRVYGMAQAYTMVQALQAAGQNPTRDSLVKAIEKAGKDWKGPGLAPFRYSADRHAGIGGMRVVQLSGTTTKPLTSVLTTDTGDAEITQYSGQESAPPSSGIPSEQPAN
jgi:ABC-type branched-subunit amino acid transport system substrate-binding protein